MDKINDGAPKMRSLNETVKLYEGNSVGVNLAEIENDSFPRAISDKPLQSCEVFLIEIERLATNHKPITHFSPPVLCSVVDQRDIAKVESNEPFDLIETYRSVIMDDQIRNTTWQGKPRQTPNISPYEESLYRILKQHIFMYQREKRYYLIEPPKAGDRIAIYYLRNTELMVNFLYIVSKYWYEILTFNARPGQTTYLVIEMESTLKQFRTLPVYAVSSLQGLSRELLFKSIRVKRKMTKESLAELEIPKTLIERLQIHAE